MSDSELLTSAEHRALRLTRELARLLNGQITGNGATRDIHHREAIAHIHALQQMIMAQAAARAYPDLYRLLGE